MYKKNILKPRKKKILILNPLLLPNVQMFNSYMTKTWCVGGKHYNKSINQTVYEKLNPKSHKLIKTNKSRCSNCGRNKSQIFKN